MHWQCLRESPEYQLRRSGRFLVAELLQPHHVLSTSARNGGRSDAVRFLVNHQSCEGSGHNERHEYVKAIGLVGYHDASCEEIGLDPACVALMGTAANMNYASIVQREFREMSVTAIVTAGVQGNAACAGDPSCWCETESGWEKIEAEPVYAGTINTTLLISCPITEAALSRAVMTMTEAKSAALQRLAVRSLYSQDYASGTTTDQFCIAAPISGGTPKTSTSTGSKLGELIGVCVRDATLEALRWQNGMEPSLGRSIFSSLRCYGLKEATFLQGISKYLDERGLELMKGNLNSVAHEPLVASAACAMATVLDRLRNGALPASSAREALRQQAASLACSLAARPDRWSDFYNRLDNVDVAHPAELALAALALGWEAKWPRT